MNACSKNPGITVAHVSHVGKVREKNEDRIAVDEARGLFIVADGMGGHLGGEVASSTAVASIAQSISEGSGLVEAIVSANEAVQTAGIRMNARNMGTTVVAMQLKGRDFHVAWVGDSRAYQFNDQLDLLTTDHSVVRGLIDSGEIQESDARNHPLRSVLTRALGGKELSGAKVGTVSGRLGPADHLLLCSDGLHCLLEDEEIHDIVRAADSVQSAVDALLQSALDRGGIDNISLILLGPSESAA